MVSADCSGVLVPVAAVLTERNLQRTIRSRGQRPNLERTLMTRGRTQLAWIAGVLGLALVGVGAIITTRGCTSGTTPESVAAMTDPAALAVILGKELDFYLNFADNQQLKLTFPSKNALAAAKRLAALKPKSLPHAAKLLERWEGYHYVYRMEAERFGRLERQGTYTVITDVKSNASAFLVQWLEALRDACQ